MALCYMKELLDRAQKQGCAVGAFSVGNMEMVIGAVKAAEEMNTPIIIQIAEGRLEHSPLHLMAPMMINAAKQSKVDIAVHLDHGASLEVIKAAIDYGFTSVMFDGSHLSFEENILKSAIVTELAKNAGVGTEAELGLLGVSEDGKVDHGIRHTDPDEVPIFCEKTSIDALAVAIGNAHGHYPDSPKLYFDVLEAIRKKTDIPLVLHGGTGISPLDFRKAIDLGIRKINIATLSFDGLTSYAKNYLIGEQAPNYFDLNENMIQGVYENIKQHIKIFNNKEAL